MDVQRLERLLKVSLGLNALSLLATGSVAYVVFAIVLAEPADVAGVQPQEKTEAGEFDEGDYRQEMRDFFERTADLLDREARKQGTNPSDVLPTSDEIDAAVESRTMHSDESQAALQKLREGFDYFDLDWPKVVPQR